MRNILRAGAIALAVTSFNPTAALAARDGSTREACLPGVLKQRLNQIRKHFGSISVVSTHRPGAMIGGSGHTSYHGSCRAVDFVPPRGKYAEVTRWLSANHSGSVGTYTCMNHIHIDNGPNMRWSKCR